MNVRLPTVEMAKPVAIIDSRATLNKDANVFTTAQHCSIYYDKHYPLQAPHQNASYHPISATHDGLNLVEVIDHLGGLGYHDVWVEAGGALFSALHKAQLVNKTYLYIVPTVLGERAVPAYHHTDIFNHACKVTWQAMGDNMIASVDWLEELCSQV